MSVKVSEGVLCTGNVNVCNQCSVKLKPKPNPDFYGIGDGFFALGLTPVGVDEAGRGSLAGPVVAAAVI